MTGLMDIAGKRHIETKHGLCEHNMPSSINIFYQNPGPSRAPFLSYLPLFQTLSCW